MASLMHCVIPQLVARSGASSVRHRSMATLSSSTPTKATNTIKGAAGKVPGTNATTTAAKAATSPPPPPTPANATAAEANPLWELWKEHKNNKWALGTVLVAALMGDAAVSWALFGNKKKDGEGEGSEEAVAAAEKVANTSVAATVA
ncbi:hypothetical protein EC957_004970 [Mortierella hygrophila]|uniref:Uncharacterized protein n=1 Tax=Mortierella hygrophila TaxID=979708 RepID=A0A9P6FEJ7_9FUNG|nr:hypothetical protein EC957_004970 [Mortierella hygrophila]